MRNNRIFKVIFISLLIITSVFNCVGCIVDGFFYGMDDLPVGEYVFSSSSPDGKYTFNTYVVENCLGSAVRGELITHNSDKDIKKNIYWSTEFSSTYVVWENASLININGTRLDLSIGHTYDSREQSDGEYSLVKTVG